MKRINLFFLLLILCPLSVKAIAFECPTVVSVGEEFVCKLQDPELIGLVANYQIDSIFSYESASFGSAWKHYYVGEDGFSVGDVMNRTSFSGELYFRVRSDAKSGLGYTLGLVQMEGVDSKYQNVLIEDTFRTIQIVEDVNTLDHLELSSGQLKPRFDKNITSYEATVNRDRIVIQAVATDSQAKVEGDLGEKLLNYGINSFQIRVTSQRGNVKIYNLYITRFMEERAKNGDATLKSLTVNHGKIDFKNNQYYYYVEVENAVKDIVVQAIPNSSLAVVSIQKSNSLAVGRNEIRVVVQAEDGTQCTYLIVVDRARKLSGEARIKNLTIKNYSLDFDPDTYYYELKLSGEEQLDFQVKLYDTKAHYKIIGNQNLKNNSTITIQVQAEDGTLKNYKIHIIKDGEANSNSLLTYLKIIPLILFVLLIGIVLFVKRCKDKVIHPED